MMENKPEFEARINSSTSLSIVANSPDVDLSTDIWAINWFNTKRSWLNNIYIALASRMVRKVGGRPIYKGRFTEKLAGDDRSGREILLIVNYPSASSFVELMGQKKFLFISILRILSVDRFVFGFTKKVQNKEAASSKQSIGTACLVHHFRGTKNIEDSLKNIVSAAAKKGIQLVYAGTKAATLKRSHDTEGSYDVPFLIDGIFVFESADQNVLKAFYESDSYQVFAKDLEHSYAGLFKKLL